MVPAGQAACKETPAALLWSPEDVMDPEKRWVHSWNQSTRQAFKENHRIKSFSEFLIDLSQSPYLLTRNAVQYLADVMEFYGTDVVRSFGEPITRFKLFQAPFGRSSDQPLMGQEEPVLEIYEALKNLVLEGRADRILQLHGPSGASKSLIVELLMRGCEEYSRTPEGAVFTFNWVFPRGDEGVTLGFGAGGNGHPERSERPEDESFAHLPSDRLDAKLPCDVGDSPILLIPPVERLALIRSMLEESSKEDRSRFVLTQYLQDGDLCPRCRLIADALLEDYEGEMAHVLRHVQVVRRFLSRRYRRGAVTISPQDTPDAAGRPLTFDASLSSLPTSLQHLNLIQLSGDLVDANTGLVEFADFLTRPPELNKYLLAATERGELALSVANVYLNLVLFATSNERHLDDFKQSPDFASFKGRMILVTVPYLLERRKEAAIYEPILARIERSKHVAPHVGSLAALWATLTRLNRPDPSGYPEDVRPLVEHLSPYEKALLFDGALPASDGRYTAQQLRSLKETLPLLRDEYRDTPIFEGRFGASPREIREILYNAVSRRSGGCLTPVVLFDELADFVKDKSLYLFLQLKPEEGYHDPEAAIESAKLEYLKVLDQEVLSAMELVPEGAYAALFERYFKHVRAFLRGEKVPAALSGQWEEPNAALMAQVEEYLSVTGPAQRFREDLMGQVAAWILENPSDPLDLHALFSSQIATLSKGFHEKIRGQVEEIGRAVLAHGSPSFQALPPHLQAAATGTLDRLVSRHGYCPTCAPDAVAFLMQHTYGVRPT
jgi:predicted Ser/Thr protein kinase